MKKGRFIAVISIDKR